ncbi:MAG: YdcF family protein [Solobacterium sp.]|nr:YdcF family protein [Solobacterium sp.]
MLKLDTRTKKPKIYNIAALSVVTAAIMGFFMYSSFDQNGVIAGAVFAMYLMAVIVMLADAFFKQIQYNLYSYNTIYYMGFALFVLVLLIFHVYGALSTIQEFGYYSAEHVLHMMDGSAKMYMLMTFPFILVFSIALFVSNIYLIRYEGKRFVNLLGMILAVLLVAGEVILYRLDYFVTGSEFELMMHDLFTGVYASVYLYIECMIIGVIIAGMIAAKYVPEPDKDFLIILGCGLNKNGKPTPLLQGRIDRALEFDQYQRKTTGKQLTFITSGGQGPDEIVSESSAMKQYLMEHGIPESRIIEEDRSVNTHQNMLFSKEKIMAVNPEGKIAFATTNYHVFRSGLHARRVKMKALGMGAETKWYFWPNAAVREFVGLLTEHRGKQILILLGMIIVYAGLTIMKYRWGG